MSVANAERQLRIAREAAAARFRDDSGRLNDLAWKVFVTTGAEDPDLRPAVESDLRALRSDMLAHAREDADRVSKACAVLAEELAKAGGVPAEQPAATVAAPEPDGELGPAERAVRAAVIAAYMGGMSTMDVHSAVRRAMEKARSLRADGAAWSASAAEWVLDPEGAASRMFDEAQAPETCALAPRLSAGDAAALVFQALGTASVCWESPEGAGEFDSARASQVGQDLLEALGYEVPANYQSESAIQVVSPSAGSAPAGRQMPAAVAAVADLAYTARMLGTSWAELDAALGDGFRAAGAKQQDDQVRARLRRGLAGAGVALIGEVGGEVLTRLVQTVKDLADEGLLGRSA